MAKSYTNKLYTHILTDTSSVWTLPLVSLGWVSAS